MPKPPRRTVRTIEYQDEPPADRAPLVDPVLEEEAETLHSVLEQFGGGPVEIKVSKWTPQGYQYCFKSDGEIDEDFIQSQFGGGRYACRIFVNGTLRLTKNLNIANRMNPAGAPGAAGSGDLQFRLLEQQMQFLRDVMLKNSAPSQTPVGELADAVSKVYALGGNQAGAPNQFDTFIKMFELAREMAADQKPGGADWKDMLIGVAKEALPLLAGAVKPQPQGAPMGPPNEEQMIRQGLAYLKKKALTMPVDLALAWVASNADEEPFRQILQLVLNREFETFAAIDADIGQEPLFGWFKSFYDGLRQEFSATHPMVDDSGGTDGDARDVTGHAAPDKRGRPNGSGKQARG